MNTKYVDFVIGDDGNIEIEANGYTDGACRNATKDFEEALGTVANRKIKSRECEVKQNVQIGKKPPRR